jgi:hypothetical protein
MAPKGWMPTAVRFSIRAGRSQCQWHTFRLIAALSSIVQFARRGTRRASSCFGRVGKTCTAAWHRGFQARVAESPDRFNQLQVVRKQRPYRLLPGLIVLVDNRREILFLGRVENAGASHQNCQARQCGVPRSAMLW